MSTARTLRHPPASPLARLCGRRIALGCLGGWLLNECLLGFGRVAAAFLGVLVLPLVAQ